MGSRRGRTALRRLLVVATLIASGCFAVDALGPSVPASAAVTSVTEILGGPGGNASLSCTGPTTCTAVSGPLEETLTNGVWSNRNDFNDEIVFSGFSGSAAVSCTDANDCTAVGHSTTGEPAYVTETDGAWGPIQTIDVGRGGEFDAVSCSDALDCTVVGIATLQEPDGDYVNAPVSATEANGTWGPLKQVAAPSTDAANNPTGGFDVSCTSPGNCILAGYGYASYIDSDYHPIFDTQTGGSWAPYAVSPVDVNEMAGLSCSAAGNCTAVGSGIADDGSHPSLVFTYTAGHWGGGTVIGEGNLTSISCVDANDCMAVNQIDSDDLIMQEIDGSWNPVPVKNELAWFSTVSCVRADECVAAGPSSYAITSTPRVDVTDNAPSYGQTLTFTATVAGTASATPYGSVSWDVLGSSGSNVCSSTTGPTGTSSIAIYTCSIAAIINDTYTATAKFNGDANYAPNSGTDQVTVTGGLPTIAKFRPLSGPAGTLVKLKGLNLKNAIKVTIGRHNTTIVSDSSTTLKIKIPTNATTGQFKVKTLNGMVISASAFKVT
jgi:hypothetical protein